MRILYIAKHQSGDNDDEGAIAHALEQLGHSVFRIHEAPNKRQTKLNRVKADFCLFHKWGTVSELAELTMPRVFWYFDMVQPIDGDPTLIERAKTRIRWMEDVLPHCVLGFCTDGDWVDADKTGKLRWLMQGADERVAGFGKPVREYPPLMFTGMVHHGQKRASHIAELQREYGNQFHILGGGGSRGRIHGRELANIFAATKIVIAPDGPNTDRYWSNRVFLTLSLGGFLLHPYCKDLERFYSEDELIQYKSREELYDLIHFYYNHEDARQTARQAGYAATMERNLYRHRCEKLIETVKEVL